MSNFGRIVFFCVIISFIFFWELLEKIFYGLPDARVEVLGYQVAAILAFAGVAGIVMGKLFLKRRRMLAAAMIGFFIPPLFFALLTFIFGP